MTPLKPELAGPVELTSTSRPVASTPTRHKLELKYVRSTPELEERTSGTSSPAEAPSVEVTCWSPEDWRRAGKVATLPASLHPSYTSKSDGGGGGGGGGGELMRKALTSSPATKKRGHVKSKSLGTK